MLAQTVPGTVVGLYQQHINPAIQHGDLFDASGTYLPRNEWNSTTTNGAMHLVQKSNTLGAEIEPVAAASIVRVIDGRELTGDQELINYGRYGTHRTARTQHRTGATCAAMTAPSVRWPAVSAAARPHR